MEGKWHTLLNIIKEEVPVYSNRPFSFKDLLNLTIHDGGFLLDLIYRISHHFCKKKGRYSLALKLLTTFGKIITSSYIHPRAEIGPRLYIAYGLGIVIGSYSKVGEDCKIFPGISIASSHPGEDKIKQPVIGNRVLIGAGAKVLGDIHIGDDCVIGANAVVLHSFASKEVIVGIPGKAVKDKKSSQNEGV